MPRLAFFPPALALRLSPSRLHALLAAHEAPRDLLALAERAPLPFARAVFDRALDDAAADDVDLLALFATPGGKRALLGAMNALRIAPGDAASLSQADLAAYVLTLRAGSAKSAVAGRMRGVVRRALLALAELGEPAFAYEYLAVEARCARDSAAALALLRAFAAGQSPLWSDVWLYEDEATGAFHVLLLTRDEADASADVPDGDGPRRAIASPLRVDRVTLDVAAGRVAIYTDHPEEAPRLLDAVARAFFDDAAFFSDRPAFTTRPLEVLGSAGLALARLPAPVTRARVIACTREVIGEGRKNATGPGALALLDQGAFAGGYLREVTLRFDVAGEEMPVDVEVGLPGRFACSSPRWQPLVREALTSLGMLAPGALPDDAWTLFPVRRPDWRLRKAIGAASVDALLAAKALKRVVSRNVTTEEARAQGGNLLTFPIPGEPGASYAVSSDPSVPTRDVTERDREVLELDLARLVLLRAKEMKLEGKPRVRGDGATLFHGELRAQTTSLAFVSVLRAPASAAEREALVKEAVAEVFPAHVVLMVPRGRAWGSGLFEVEFDGLVEGGLSLVERAVKLARLEDEVAPCRLTDAPLVVERKTRRVWFHETPMELADSGYAMIEGLALRPGISTTREVCKWLSAAREDLQAAKATRRKIVRWIAASFTAVGKKISKQEIEQVVVIEGKRGYRLGVAARVF